VEKDEGKLLGSRWSLVDPEAQAEAGQAAINLGCSGRYTCTEGMCWFSSTDVLFRSYVVYILPKRDCLHHVHIVLQENRLPLSSVVKCAVHPNLYLGGAYE